MKGIYHNSSSVNGKPSWTTNFQAIWMRGGMWYVGFLDNIGTNMAGLTSYHHTDNGCPFDIPSEQWTYFNGYIWDDAGPNEIKLKCLKGNLFLHHSHLFVLLGLENSVNEYPWCGI